MRPAHERAPLYFAESRPTGVPKMQEFDKQSLIEMYKHLPAGEETAAAIYKVGAEVCQLLAMLVAAVENLSGDLRNRP